MYDVYMSVRMYVQELRDMYVVCSLHVVEWKDIFRGGGGKAAGCVLSDVKDLQLLIEVTVFVFEQVSVSQSHRHSSPDVAVVGGAGVCACGSESVSKMWMVCAYA